ncbi:unnamed protein product [Rhizoctonia solani]|uniref:NAD(P)-binding protein n=1 Tax=Rhizoctonia solani TaxID=456999 RepID=A0A8H3BFM5_9AGAM|nr:unnamed protein product [Rhizoctonia solani]
MTSPKSVFLLGATGYIGGSLLVTLLKDYPSATISVLVRNPQSAEAVRSISPNRIKIVLGSHSDVSIIEAEAETADLTINAADCDDLNLTKSIISGLEKKSQKGILIHTSGTALLLAEGATGPFLGKIDERGDKIWDDTKTEDIQAIPSSALHRPVDIAVLDAHNSGVVDAYIVCPGFVYGPGIGPVKTTSLIPIFLQVYLRRRQAYFVGEGTNIWCNIHIQDLVQMYRCIISHALATAGASAKVDAYSNYYFAASSEHIMKDVVELIAAALHKRDLTDSSHAQSLSPEDPDGKVLAMYLGHTSRAISVRARSLGWFPNEKKLTESSTIETEIEHILKATT